jgi:hypothetical protein
MADHYDAGKFGSFVVFGPFTAENVTTEASNQDLAVGQMSYAVVPYGGSVVGIAACLSAAVSAGSITVRAHKAGTELDAYSYPTAVLDATNTISSYGSAAPGAVTFSAGDRLGLSITGSATLDAETKEVDAYLIVQLNAS